MTIKHPFSTRRGRRVRRLKLQSNPLCEPCKREGKVVVAETVHHIKPLHEGGAPYAQANLESRCGDCHKAIHGSPPKVKIDAKTGLPRKGEPHWWNDP